MVVGLHALPEGRARVKCKAQCSGRRTAVTLALTDRRECVHVSVSLISFGKTVDARVQRFELLATLMLVRQRQPPTDAAVRAQHVGLAAAVMGLPSGLLAIIGEIMARPASYSCVCEAGSICAQCSAV